MAKRMTVEQWITEACQDADKGHALTVLALLHLKGIGTEEVHTKEIKGPQNFQQLSEFFVNKACAFSQDLTGIQSFRLQAFYGKSEPQASFTFTVFEGSLTAGEQVPWSKHEATPSGLLAQMMKHNEHHVSTITSLTQGFLGMLINRDIAHQAEKAEMNMVMRDILLNLRKEDQAARMEQLKFQRESQEREMFGRALPGLVNYLTGSELIPQSHADSQLVEAMALKFGPQDLQMLVSMGKINQQEALLLAQRFTKIREEAEKRKAALAVIPPEGDSANGTVESKPTVQSKPS